MGSALVGLGGAFALGIIGYYLSTVRPRRTAALMKLTKFEVSLRHAASASERRDQVDLLLIPLMNGGADPTIIEWLPRVLREQESLEQWLLSEGDPENRKDIEAALMEVPAALVEIVRQIDADIAHPWDVWGHRARRTAAAEAAHGVRGIYMEEWLLPPWVTGRTALTRLIRRRLWERRLARD